MFPDSRVIRVRLTTNLYIWLQQNISTTYLKFARKKKGGTELELHWYILICSHAILTDDCP